MKLEIMGVTLSVIFDDTSPVPTFLTAVGGIPN